MASLHKELIYLRPRSAGNPESVFPGKMKAGLVLILQVLPLAITGEESGYSFYKFFGPVSGSVYPIRVVHPRLGKESLDFVAKPDYSYSFGVQDPETGNAQTREESRDGDAIKGEYSVLQPDGALRTVKYTSDPKNGFQATVHYSTSNNAINSPNNEDRRR